MANNIFRERLIAKIKAAKAEYNNVTAIDHPYMKGRIREIFVQNLIEPFLPEDFKVGSGKITDVNGNLSSETDLIIYSNKLIPPIMYGERLGVFPVDSCIATLEVKSKLTAAEIDDTIKKSDKMLGLGYTSGKFSSVGTPLPHSVGVATRNLFAFESDITDKDELVRYSERDTQLD
jgi:hypothetical protein